eukprot:gnl/MRDRNA2_/MRDRNA2_159606_c0_seq1.p1 gnl/MRDRNA2_/MRDRNA2_159606_c0~~gnl/MRDRNA2_/MRDRNA2_159606_c0_seq1.p1  ORF type:complete len:164 (+),score=18.04 gnl/MRDRNA2_/MRDRNA2_159606_c0_seq1:127-618(+)
MGQQMFCHCNQAPTVIIDDRPFEKLGRVVAPSMTSSASSSTTTKMVPKLEKQAQTWEICSESEIHVRSEASHMSTSLGYLHPGQEFQAFGPYRIQTFRGTSLSNTEWLRLSNHHGFVCMTLSSDPTSTVVALKSTLEARRSHQTFQEAADRHDPALRGEISRI